MSDSPDTKPTEPESTVTAGDEEEVQTTEATETQEHPDPPEPIKRSDREARYRLRAKEAEGKVDNLTDQVRTLRLRLAFNSVAAEAHLTDTDAAWKLASDDLTAVQVSEDGTVDTDRIARIVAHVADRYPYLTSEPSPSPAETDTFSPDTPSGRPTNRVKKSTPLDVATLERRFPALARRGRR